MSAKRNWKFYVESENDMGLLQLLAVYNEMKGETHHFRMFADGSGRLYRSGDIAVYAFSSPADFRQWLIIRTETAPIGAKVYL